MHLNQAFKVYMYYYLWDNVLCTVLTSLVAQALLPILSYMFALGMSQTSTAATKALQLRNYVSRQQTVQVITLQLSAIVSDVQQ